MQRIWMTLGLALFVGTLAHAGPRIERENFGKLADGTSIDLFTLSTERGLTVKVTNYGATLTSLIVPDRQGKPLDIVLGYDDVKSYVEDASYFGCSVGRYANRIKQGKFTLEGQEYKLAVNGAPNHLHGGKIGFNKKVWKAMPKLVKDSAKVIFSHTSPDGDEGYPGELNVTVEYTLRDNTLMIDYIAYTNKTTVLNLTNHSYFNLNGHNRGEILDHEMTIFADKYTINDENLIPTGKIETVKATAMDFTLPVALGKNIRDTGLKDGGYDHNFVLRGDAGSMKKAAEVLQVCQIQCLLPGSSALSG
jgi:aldose 1-epimerase